MSAGSGCACHGAPHTGAASGTSGSTAFAFDLACVLETRPYDHDADQE
jgi:hypothetical protein